MKILLAFIPGGYIWYGPGGGNEGQGPIIS